MLSITIEKEQAVVLLA
ncbi:hypothetical protein OCT59_028292 [Rhizophagus irregularis]|nr:hypothetical protein OCT59_028292 [Rhizophagus irregularis]